LLSSLILSLGQRFNNVAKITRERADLCKQGESQSKLQGEVTHRDLEIISSRTLVVK